MLNFIVIPVLNMIIILLLLKNELLLKKFLQQLFGLVKYYRNGQNLL